MKRILIALIATAALAAPTAASAHHGHGLYAKLTGTGTSFAGTSATASGTIAKGTLLDSGTFSASLATTWSSATAKTFDRGTLSCAPATASLNVAGTLASNLTGRTCAFTKTDGTVVRAFFGRGTADAAGTRAKLWLMQKADGSVQGAVWTGTRENVLFVKGERAAKHSSGCDH
jgi:hypothetical protein